MMKTTLADHLAANRASGKPPSFYSRLDQAVASSITHETIPIAFTLLFDPLNTPELVNNPILHATTHTLIALNIPLQTRTKQKETLKNASGTFWKSDTWQRQKTFFPNFNANDMQMEIARCAGNVLRSAIWKTFEKRPSERVVANAIVWSDSRRC